MALGAKVITVSDSTGTVVDEEGFTSEKLAELMDVKNHERARIHVYAERIKATFISGARPWHVPVDVALPCATQNELNDEDAASLIKNGRFWIVTPFPIPLFSTPAPLGRRRIFPG